jgi:hypothetical protein
MGDSTSAGSTKTNDLRGAARGFGRYYQRHRFNRDAAVETTVRMYPQFRGYESDIAAGWSAEAGGR